jgi:hypothetical protein
MNASAKWLRRALLGGVALGAMATGAQADELSALKAQLEALQSRVNQIESSPAASSAPAGASYMTFNRGSDLNAGMFKSPRLDDQLPGDRGFTIAITPTADLPAPIMEVAISGYVLMLASYDTHSNTASSGGGAIVQGGGDDANFQMDALRSRFRITSKSDTAVGQVRTLIEGDFRDVGTIGNQVFRLRHAWGEWDMTPNTVFGAGQTWSTNYHGYGETPMVNWNGQYGTSGYNKSWVPQVQIRHTSGPLTYAVGLMNPYNDGIAADPELPDLGARITGSLGSASFGIGAVARVISFDKDGVGAGASDSAIGAGISAGVDIPFGDMITLHATAGYGDGANDMTGSGNSTAFVGGNVDTLETWGGTVGASFKLSEASSINANYAISDSDDNNLAATAVQTNQAVALNYIWQPVSKLRMGVEAYWRNDELVNGNDEDNLRLTFGTWFFF